MFTSIIVPFVITPRDVYIDEDGFFFYANNRQAKCRLKFGMRDMRL